MNTRMHNSDEAILRFYDTSKEQMIAKKPTGLWYGFGDSWTKFWGQDSELGKYNYAIDVSKHKMLVISSMKEAMVFQAKYGWDMSGEDTCQKMCIDWDTVAEEYDGVEITNVFWDYKAPDWLYSWDVASGCIWR